MGIGYLIYRYFDFKHVAERLRLARDGERIVGQFLESAGRRGAGIPWSRRRSIQHRSCVGQRHGIFVLETKSYSKPGQGDAVVRFRWRTSVSNGFQPKRNPVRQAKALTKWLDDQLFEGTGKRFPIRPMVLLPGWFVETHTKSVPDVWVLNPKMLSAYIEREPVVLTTEDVALVA